MADQRRLIEVGFPLKQASLDSVHEKNVRHGHISTLHIWPARRPLAAARAALIATLLPDPGTPEERKKLLEKLGGKVVQKNDGGQIKEETVGGILHWGRESGPDLAWFREEIRKAYGGRAPRVLDPFAGGGAIPLEAMRLGCEVTAIDINPVAWFILKCTLEYPQKLAGQKRPLPDFVLRDREFMESFLKAQGLKGATLRTQLERLGLGDEVAAENSAKISPGQNGSFGFDGAVNLDADLAWHVRAWGRWLLKRARTDLERFYPTIDGKPTVAYLWARTVKCKNCRATIPLLKTKWLCRKDNKRVLLRVEPNADRTGPVFSILSGKDAATQGGNGAQRREYDRKIGAGTMSRAGATCVCCGLPSMTMEDLRLEGKAGRLGAMMTAVVVDGPDGKEYRLPTDDEIRRAAEAENEVERVFAEIPFGIPDEPLPSKEALGFRVPLYGFDRWSKLFTPRQLIALGTFVKHTRNSAAAMEMAGYPLEWRDGMCANLCAAIGKLVCCLANIYGGASRSMPDKRGIFAPNRQIKQQSECGTYLRDRTLADYIAALCTWHITGEKMSHVFVRFALPMNWDYCELNPLSDSSGNYWGCLDWVARVADHTLQSARNACPVTIAPKSALVIESNEPADVVVTDPPYYDAIPYSDLMDFFYVWLRRTLHGISPEIDDAFAAPLGPKWSSEKQDGELIDDSSRFGGDKTASKKAYEDGMFRAFQACDRSLVPDGRMIVVFANKSPDAWETLVSAIIRAGFVVDASWPIQTEREARIRAYSSAALASSVWLVCRKRRETARPGWDNRVLDEM